MNIFVGQRFNSFADFKEAIYKNAESEGFSVRYAKSDRSRNVVVCKTSKLCSYKVTAWWQPKIEKVEIKRVEGEHTACLQLGEPKITAQKSNQDSEQEFLRKVVPDILTITRATKPVQIQRAIQKHCGQKIEYQAAKDFLAYFLQTRNEIDQEEIRLLPTYIEMLKNIDPNGTFSLEMDTDSRNFRRLFICPSASASAFKYTPRFIQIASDGSFTKTTYLHTFLFAFTVDADNAVLLLAWAVVEIEDEDSWGFFFSQLSRALPELKTEPFTLISDRESGLSKANDAFTWVFRSYCCAYLAETVHKMFGNKAREAFWKVARSQSKEQCDAALAKLRHNIDAHAANYLKNVSLEMFASAYFPGPRYGYDTCNIVEFENAFYLEDRVESVLTMLNSIWHKEIDKRSLRLKQAEMLSPSVLLTPHGQYLLREACQHTQGNRVWMSSSKLVHVTQLDNQTMTVDLEERTCTCRRYQANFVPCGHAISVINRLVKSPIDYMPPHLMRSSWLLTYKKNFPLINLDIIRNIHISNSEEQKSTQYSGGPEPTVFLLSIPPPPFKESSPLSTIISICDENNAESDDSMSKDYKSIPSKSQEDHPSPSPSPPSSPSSPSSPLHPPPLPPSPPPPYGYNLRRKRKHSSEVPEQSPIIDHNTKKKGNGKKRHCKTCTCGHGEEE